MPTKSMGFVKDMLVVMDCVALEKHKTLAALVTSYNICDTKLELYTLFPHYIVVKS